MPFKTTAENGERGTTVTCNGRLFHEHLQQETHRHRQWVEHPEMLMRQNLVVVWLW